MAHEYQHDVVIAIGSNIEPETKVPLALERISAAPLCIVAVSNFYWSAAVGDNLQPRFMNGACRIRTDRSPRELKFTVLRGIEDALGRVRGADRYAPREIDLDIALFDQLQVDGDGLHIPDPDILSRPFLTIPLAEIAADWVVPGLGATLGAIAAGMPRDGLVLDEMVTARCRQAALKESQQ
jgi:2-amino-4-hydroxy-6-hydroxymethyldihydropteridine diphosphokinase